MNIVIINDHAAMNGGAAMVAIQSAIGFAQRGHRVIYFAANGPPSPQLAAGGVEVVCLDQPDINTASSAIAFTRIATWNRLAEQQLAKLIASLDPRDTIVHLHSWAKVLSPSIGRTLSASRAPMVATLHEYYWACPNGGFYEYPRGQICRRAPMSLACVSTNCDQRSYPRKLWRVGRQVLLNQFSGLKETCRHAITLSATMERALRPHLPASIAFHRVDNPIDVIDPGAPARDRALGDFLYVGRLSQEKGVRFLCQAATQLNLRARIVGDGPLKADLQREFPEHDFIGWKSPAEVAEEMRRARALVFPSIWYEGQPLTIYEALARGCPAIVSDDCAGAEAIRDHETGRLFRSGDVASLAAAMTDLLDDERARLMSAQAHARYWAAPLTLDRHLDRVMEVYRAAMMADEGIVAA